MKSFMGRLLSIVRSIIAEWVKIEFSKPEKFGVKDNIQLKLIHNFYSRYHPIILDGTVKEDSKRNVLDRLEVIQENLRGLNCLDIGCGAGFFTFNIARLGYWVTGIDSDKIILRKSNLLKKKHNIPNAELRYFPIDERSVEKLPIFDNILYLSIHHHLIENYGLEKAANILRVIATKTKLRLFFDFPLIGSIPDSSPESYIERAGFNEIVCLGVFWHTQKQHEKRPLFMAVVGKGATPHLEIRGGVKPARLRNKYISRGT